MGKRHWIVEQAVSPDEQAEKILTGISFLSKADQRNAIRAVAVAIDSEQERYHLLWHMAYSWCLVQKQHPGCLPDTQALMDVLDKRKP